MTTTDTPIMKAYSPEAANQFGGGELPYFVGKQYGAGWLGTIARVAFPLLKRFVGAAGNVAEDVLYKDKTIGQSIKKHAVNEIANLATNIATAATAGAPRKRSGSINRRAAKRKHESNYPLFENRAKRRRRK